MIAPVRGGRRFRKLTLLLWAAFVLRGALHVAVAPLWNGFDEPYHLAYAEYLARFGKVPGYPPAPAIPGHYFDATRLLPGHVAMVGAPSFADWAFRSEEARSSARALERAATAGAWRGETEFPWGNYERQQPPLYYVVLAPAAWLLSGLPLSERLVLLRLASVLLASLVVPLTVRFARLVLPRGAVPLAGALLVLAPNSVSFVFRVTNDALAWPLLALALGSAVLVVRRPRSGSHALAFGLAAAAGTWTKLTLLPLIPAGALVALLALRRRDGRRLFGRHVLLMVGLPALLVAPLFAWNRQATGSLTGIVYRSAAQDSGPADYLRAAARISWRGPIEQAAQNHLWAGGWEFRKPPGAAYAPPLALIAVGAPLLLLAGLRDGGWRRRLARLAAPGTFAALFVAAYVWHVVSFGVAAAATGKTMPGGGEGWYFDLVRPLEAVLGALLCAAPRSARARTLLAGLVPALLVAADAAATYLLLLVHWGAAPAAFPPGDVLERACRAAPIELPAGAVAAGAALWLAAALAAVVAGFRDGSGSPGMAPSSR